MRSTFLALMLFASAGMTSAQTYTLNPNEEGQFYRNIAVTGFAQKEIEPTYVTLNVTFSQEDGSTQKAMEGIDAQTQQLVSELEAVSEAIEVTLDRFEIVPTYEGLIWSKFRVSRTINVKIKDFDLMSEAIDRIGASKPYWTSGLEFKNDETGAIERELMDLAAEDARAQAEALLAKVGGKLGAPLQVEFMPQNAVFAAPMAEIRSAAFDDGGSLGKERIPQLDPSLQMLSTSVRVIYEILPE